jgi:hypothetical protein
MNDVLLNSSKDVGLAINIGKTKYKEVGRRRMLMTNELITVGSNSYEKVNIFNFLGSLLTNQNYIHVEIRYTLKAGQSCYYSFQSLLSPRLLSKNLKMKIYETLILPVVLYGVREWRVEKASH